MPALNGSDFYGFFNGSYWAGQVSGNINLTRDTIDVTTKDSSGDAKEFIYGEYTGTATVSQIVNLDNSENITNPLTALLSGTTGTCKIGVGGSSGKILTGQALITSVTWTGDKNEAQNAEFNIQFSGEITQSTSFV